MAVEANVTAHPPRLNPLFKQVSAMILRPLLDRAEASCGIPVRSAVITVPAHFGSWQREATKRAGRLAGLHHVELLQVPPTRRRQSHEPLIQPGLLSKPRLSLPLSSLSFIPLPFKSMQLDPASSLHVTHSAPWSTDNFVPGLLYIGRSFPLHPGNGGCWAARGSPSDHTWALFVVACLPAQQTDCISHSRLLGITKRALGPMRC